MLFSLSFYLAIVFGDYWVKTDQLTDHFLIGISIDILIGPDHL